MVNIPPERDKFKLTYTFAFGLAPFPDFTIKDSLVSQVLLAYGANISRLKAMMTLPSFIGFFSGNVQRLNALAEFELTGKLNYADGPKKPGEAKSIYERFKVLYNQCRQA